MKGRTGGLAGSNKILPVLLLKGNLMNISKITLAAALAASALVATPALAQDAPADGLTVTGSATIVSDYRFRGISLSDRDATDRKCTRLNSSHYCAIRMTSSACKQNQHHYTYEILLQTTYT